MTGYQLPVGDVYVSCSWYCHLDRMPPSPEPGTDYAVPTGTPVAAADDGYVYAVYPNTGPAGRVVEIRLDDGRTIRYLHLSEVWVQIGWRVSRGDVVADSGASGNGSPTYYGPHLHVSLLPSWTAPLYLAIDFQAYVGEPEPEPEPPPEPEPDWKEIEMDYYARGSDDAQGRIWLVSLRTKTKRQLTPSEWATVQEAYDAAELKVPLSTPTSSQLGTFANVQATEASEVSGRTIGQMLVAIVGAGVLLALNLAVDIYSAIKANGP